MENKGQAWEVLKSEPGEDLILFRARYDWVRNPRTAAKMKAVILEAPDWVNVVALTPQGKVLVVRQHRFGIGHATLEIPAGLVDPGEAQAEAVRRELAEETGYTSPRWTYLGWVEANPAFMNNRCHIWLAQDAVSTLAVELDDGEDIAVGEMSFDEIRGEIEAGRMRNALTLVALGRVFDLRGVGMGGPLE